MKLTDLRRICDAHTECDQCPFDAACCGAWVAASKETLDKIESRCEKWLAEHPEPQKKTRQSKLLECFPTAHINLSGAVNICPAAVDEKAMCITERGCYACKKAYWLAEIKDDEA